jgi:hypothetical protein
MARLNEPPVAPPPPVENNDAELVAGASCPNFSQGVITDGAVVKRKFLRQNRELAKYVLPLILFYGE